MIKVYIFVDQAVDDQQTIVSDYVVGKSSSSKRNRNRNEYQLIAKNMEMTQQYSNWTHTHPETG